MGKMLLVATGWLESLRECPPWLACVCAVLVAGLLSALFTRFLIRFFFVAFLVGLAVLAWWWGR